MRDIGEYLKLIYSFSAAITKLRKADITLACGVTINTAAMSMMNVIDWNPELRKNMVPGKIIRDLQSGILMIYHLRNMQKNRYNICSRQRIN